MLIPNFHEEPFIGCLRDHPARTRDQPRSKEFIDENADLSQNGRSDPSRAQRHACTKARIKHPSRDDNARVLRHRADVDLFATTSLAVMHRDLGTASGVPSIVHLCSKCDMGRMTWDLPSAGRTTTAPGQRGTEIAALLYFREEGIPVYKAIGRGRTDIRCSAIPRTQEPCAPRRSRAPGVN